MPRYFLELAYKGTAYSGFQVQQNAPTIQLEVERALKVIYRHDIELTGSSRTDAGVHALQNYFHFDTDLVIEDRHIYNLNAVLPQDITIKTISRVNDTAHCRFDAVSRRYRYFIYNRKDPFQADRGWLYPYPVDFNLLQEAAAVVMEYGDFTSFSKRNTQVKTFQCRITVSEWQATDNGLIYNVESNRFLRGMVRGLVGTMLKVGRGQVDMAGFRAIIEAKDCSQADFTTPPQGLFLVSVNYTQGLLEQI